MRLSLFLASLLLACGSAFGSTHRLVDGGVEKEFEVDCTMLICRPVGGIAHVVSIGDHKTEQGILTEASRLEQTSAPRYDLLLYQKGKPREPRYERWLGRKICVHRAAGALASNIALASGASSFETPHFAPDYTILTFPQSGDSLGKLEAVRRLPGVASADPLMARKKSKRLIPDDPEFSHSVSNPQYQWHLRNTGQNGSAVGHDINVTEVWDTIRGAGVTISIVDDGLQVAHPDLAANVNTAIDHDWNDGTPDDPTPDNPSDDHGTSCAGVAAARGNNGIGVSGAAPEASLVGLRLIAAETTDQQDGEAIAWRTDVVDISSNSWGPDDSGEEFFVAGPLIAAAFENGVTSGRGAKGTIYVWAAGNGRDSDDYSNYDGYNNRIETISVGAVSFDGRQSFYSESGANVLICAPSDDDDGQPGITTTTLTTKGSYVDNFGGTSSATPLVSGVIALVLQKNPDLGWRDVQEILVRSAKKVDAGDSGWVNNAAGFHFNHRYGAGMVDASAAVALAEGWANLGTQQKQVFDSGALDVAIPDDNPTGVTQTLSTSASSGMRLEHVQLTVDIEHSYRGDLEIFLTSPSGTVSQFTEEHDDDNSGIRDFTFLSVRNWGEMSSGDWTVRIADRANGDTGVVKSLSLNLFGTVPLSGYELWASTQIPAGQDAAESADIDGDGRVNFLEYAFSSNPTAPGDQAMLQLGPTGIEFDVDTNNDDLIYSVEVSTDLVSWQAVASSLVSTSGSIQKRRAIFPEERPVRYHFRIKVSRVLP